MNNNDTLQVRDKRANNRYFIDNALLRGGWGNKLGPHAIAVYNAIALHADIDTQSAYPSRQKIADLTGMSSRQVSRELEKLAAYKIIHIESRAIQRKSSLIFLLDVDEWTPPHQTEGHMPESHMSSSQPTTDSQSDEHMTGSHTNKTHENKTQRTKPQRGAAEKTPPAPASSGDYLTDIFIGNTQDNGLREGERLIQLADWDIRNPEHRRAMVTFLEASRLPIPAKPGGRKDWINSIDIHVQTYGVTELEKLYPRVVEKMRGEGLTVSRPGSVTNNMADMVARQATEPSTESSTPDWAQEDWEPTEELDFITS